VANKIDKISFVVEMAASKPRLVR